MTTAAATVVVTTAAMTEPIPASAAERLAALRTPSKDRGKPAKAWKILTAGVSTSAMFGLVAAMGWGGTTAQSTALPADTTLPGDTTVQIVPVSPVAPTSAPVAPTSAPTTPTVAPLIPSTPVATVLVTIPVAVPAPQAVAQKTTTRATSNATTKSSS